MQFAKILVHMGNWALQFYISITYEGVLERYRILLKAILAHHARATPSTP
jgi:hypothetical protein